jgi:hypothetical protein
MYEASTHHFSLLFVAGDNSMKIVSYLLILVNVLQWNLTGTNAMILKHFAEKFYSQMKKKS